MRHTDAQIEEAARRFGQLADQLDPATAEVEDLSDLRAIAEAADQVRRDEALVIERVAAARARGRKFTERVYEVRYLDTSPLAGSAPRAAGAPADPSAGDKAAAEGR
jgi:hypothetical protein